MVMRSIVPAACLTFAGARPHHSGDHQGQAGLGWAWSERRRFVYLAAYAVNTDLRAPLAGDPTRQR